MNYQVPPVQELSLEQILHNVEPKLKRVLWRHRIPLQDADDLLQETFLIMVSKSGSIRNPEAWLLATLANRCIIYWRKHRSRLWDLVDSAILELLAEAGTAAARCSGSATAWGAARRRQPNGPATGNRASAR
jgi:DNA-directed RNA polymerase specialized sigma24 family protein